MAFSKTNNADNGHTSRFTQFDDLKGRLAPVEGYEKMPLLSLEEAIKPLRLIVRWLEGQLKTLMGYAEVKDGLTVDESASIFLYTYEYRGSEKETFYALLNDLLREGNRQKLIPWFSYLRLFINALSKLPTEKKSMVYRGVKNKDVFLPGKGETMIWPAFSSCTTTIDVLQSEKFLGKMGSRTLFVIEAQSGRSIQKHSFHTTEDEVLIPMNRPFQIISILDAGNGLTLVDLKEVDPSVAKSASTAPVSSRTKSTGPYQNPKLEQVINRFPSQSLVKLTGEMLNNQDMEIVVRQAINGKRCSELDMMANDIRMEGASIVANALPGNKSLEHLNISYNRIGDMGVRFIAENINRSAVNILDLGETYMSDEGAASLADMLKTNRTLTRLILNENEITDQGLTPLIKVLTDKNRTLKILDLSMNKYITRASLDALINMIKRNTSLTKVDIRRCGMTRADEARIAAVFAERDDSDESSESENF